MLFISIRIVKELINAYTSKVNLWLALLRKDGGARRDRTADPLLAKQVLSQLSYSPDTDIRKLERGIRIQSIRPDPGSDWWVWEDLNFRPHPYQGCALTN